MASLSEKKTVKNEAERGFMIPQVFSHICTFKKGPKGRCDKSGVSLKMLAALPFAVMQDVIKDINTPV